MADEKETAVTSLDNNLSLHLFSKDIREFEVGANIKNIPEAREQPQYFTIYLTSLYNL